jgi:hypothetical protein
MPPTKKKRIEVIHPPAEAGGKLIELARRFLRFDRDMPKHLVVQVVLRSRFDTFFVVALTATPVVLTGVAIRIAVDRLTHFLKPSFVYGYTEEWRSASLAVLRSVHEIRNRTTATTPTNPIKAMFCQHHTS